MLSNTTEILYVILKFKLSAVLFSYIWKKM